jgi:RNA polymerase sigma-70 factor (ECF subfamily)
MQTMTQPNGPQPSLVERAQRGDAAALDLLFAECRPRLVALAAGLIGERVRCEVEPDDALQETYARACASIGTFEWRGEDSFLRWLSVILRNVILEAAKRQARAPGPLEEAALPAKDPSPSRRLRREERFDRLQGAINYLSPDHRQVVVLSRIEGLPLNQVAERMGRSHAAVRQLLRRALQHLRERLGDTESLGLPPRGLDGGEAHDR